MTLRVGRHVFRGEVSPFVAKCHVMSCHVMLFHVTRCCHVTCSHVMTLSFGGIEWRLNVNMTLQMHTS